MGYQEVSDLVEYVCSKDDRLNSHVLSRRADVAAKVRETDLELSDKADPAWECLGDEPPRTIDEHLEHCERCQGVYSRFLETSQKYVEGLAEEGLNFDSAKVPGES